jgi:Amt family ammonium transporter
MDLDSLWVAFAAALVMLMQAGFLCLEAGFVRERHAEGVALKNLVDWVLSTLIFFAVGFGLMFGESLAGVVGSSLFALHGLAGIDGPIAMNGVFFLFQLGFAGTSATIVSGAIAGRVSVLAYLCSTIAIATLVYPVIGHWAWGNALIGSNEPWLASLGFIDFAGSTVVHGSGAWFALVAAHSIGPRRGRFDARGAVRPIPTHSIALATLGVFLLWLGWWGFNGGSTLRFDARVASIIINTNLAGAAGALVAFVHGWRFQDGRDLSAKLLGGTLGGLVAVTASCHLVSPLGAVFVGAVGGWGPQPRLRIPVAEAPDRRSRRRRRRPRLLRRLGHPRRGIRRSGRAARDGAAGPARGPGDGRRRLLRLVERRRAPRLRGDPPRDRCPALARAGARRRSMRAAGSCPPRSRSRLRPRRPSTRRPCAH